MNKDIILNAAISILEKGNFEDFSIRKIAMEANVSKSSIAYYFKTKEQLIYECSDQIISRLLMSFCIEDLLKLDSFDGIKTSAIGTMDYLFRNQNIANASILFDVNNPRINDNTSKMIQAFSFIIGKGSISKITNTKAFMIVSSLQELFIRRNTILEQLKINIYEKEERDALIINILKNILAKEEENEKN